eukprot:366512-Chlamydomonas_euryale.AAC.6
MTKSRYMWCHMCTPKCSPGGHACRVKCGPGGHACTHVVPHVYTKVHQSAAQAVTLHQCDAARVARGVRQATSSGAPRWPLCRPQTPAGRPSVEACPQPHGSSTSACAWTM